VAKDSEPFISRSVQRTEPTLFWQARTSQFMVFAHVPYLSQCRGYDAHVPLWQLMEHASCQFVNPMTAVDPLNPTSQAVSDTCRVSINCTHEVLLSAGKHWFQMASGATPFRLSRYAIEPQTFARAYLELADEYADSSATIPVTRTSPGLLCAFSSMRDRRYVAVCSNVTRVQWIASSATGTRAALASS
jgi:hypothetical protein